VRFNKLIEPTIWAMWGLIVGGACLWVTVGSIGYFSRERWLPNDTAGWVQAIGSIAAIFTAVAIGVHQTRSASRQRVLDAESKRKSCLAVVEFSAQQGQALSDYLGSLESLWPYVSAWENKFASVNRLSLDSLAAIPMHELGDNLAVLAFSEIYTNLASIREESIGLVTDIKAKKNDNSARINAIHSAAAQLKGDLLNFQMHYRVAPSN